MGTSVEDQQKDDHDLDREHEQLFHELRSVIPGAEVLFAFLLTIAFTERFNRLTDLQRGVYYATFLTAGVTLVLLLAPTAFHRVRFRQRDKEAMMRTANIEMITAMLLISLSNSGVVFLITDLLFDATAAVSASAALFVFTLGLWWAVPLWRAVQDRSSSN